MPFEPKTIMDLDNTFFLQKKGLLIESWQKSCLKKVATFKKEFTMGKTINQGDWLFNR